MGSVTVITSGKGGVGKSTVSVGLARALADRGRKVLLIDCDSGLRSLDRLTGTDKELVYDLSDVLSGRCAPIKAIYKCEVSENLYMMPAADDSEFVLSENGFAKLVALVRKYFDAVLLDSPAGIGPGFRSACMAADKALVVCNADPVCLRSTAKVNSMLKEMGVSKQRLIINRFNNAAFNALHGFDDLDRVIDEARIRLIGVIPEDYDFVNSMINNIRKDRTDGFRACSRIAGRLEGIDVPLII